MWGIGDDNIDDDSEPATFKSDPPRDAMIQVVDRTGKVVEVKRLERPLAKLRTVQLYGDSRLTYLLTVDYSAGFGSYSGPITRLVEVKSGQRRWIESTEAKTGKTREISLMESLKTTWKFVDAPDRKGKQILLAQCRPDWSSVKDNPDFATTYARFYFHGTKWLAKERTVKGISGQRPSSAKPKRHLYLLDESSLASTKTDASFPRQNPAADRVLVIGDT